MDSPTPKIAALTLALGAVACSDDGAGTAALKPPLESSETPGANDRYLAQSAPLVVFLGDSLTAGNGLPESEAYPALLQGRLARAGSRIRLVNAGVSGDTSAGGLARMNWLLAQRPDVLVVALGANDGLRGLPVSELELNLSAIVDRARAGGARVLLAGMRMPPNYGEDYARDFAAVYGRVAADQGVPLVPFLLEGVGGNPALNQSDGIHPNALGQEKLADNVEKGLLELLPSK